jgi:hypothetical protein
MVISMRRSASTQTSEVKSQAKNDRSSTSFAQESLRISTAIEGTGTAHAAALAWAFFCRSSLTAKARWNRSGLLCFSDFMYTASS